MSELLVNHVARIEGHGTISIEVEDGAVKDIHMDIVEPARLFEAMVVGRPYHETSYISSRICGICSPSHTVTSIKATEAAMGIEVSDRTRKLRQLLVYGSFLQNHATHLYLLVVPDFTGTASVFPLAETAPDVVRRALSLKRLGNELCTVVGGRSVHPIRAVVGGFTSEPSPQELLDIADRLAAAARDCIDTGDLFAGFDVPDFETAGDLLALVSPDDYAIYDGEVGALSAGWKRPASEYRQFVKEHIVGHSNAKYSLLEDGSTFMVGALARVNHSWDRLLPSARVVAAKAGLRPVCKNTFRNNMCQAIELVDVAERCAQICRELAETAGSAAVVDFEVKAGEGTGATEAPRGTVYHSLAIDDKGIVVAGNVLTPTAQNLANLEADMHAFAPTVVHLPREEFILAVEKLVRAYDPCLSCAVH